MRLVCTLVASLAALAVSAQESAFSSLPQPEKLRLLSALYIPNPEVPQPSDALPLLRAGMNDPDVQVRLAAVGTLHARAYISKVPQGPARDRAKGQAQLRTLIPDLVRRLSDPEPRVRDLAVRALGTVDAVEGAGGSLQTSVETMKRFAAMFKTETSARVRATIMNTFSLMSEYRTDIEAESIIVAGLADSDPGVLNYAASGVGRARLPQHLRKLLPLLRHKDRGVRMGAAVSFNILAAQSAPFIGELQRAADSELEDSIKQTLLAAIKRAREPGK